MVVCTCFKVSLHAIFFFFFMKGFVFYQYLVRFTSKFCNRPLVLNRIEISLCWWQNRFDLIIRF